MNAQQGRLVNLGSLCIDRVYAVAAIARAGETLASTGFDIHPGGKGLNQSIAAARAGASVLHVGAVGEDGAWLVELLARERVATSIRPTDGASGHAAIQVTPAGENAIVIVGGANRRIDAGDRSRALTACGAGDWLLLQNEINDLDAVLRDAAAQQLQVCLNLAPFDQRALHYPLDGVGILIVNAIEATGLTGIVDPRAALARLHQLLPRARIVLTLGAEGLLHAAAGGSGTLPAFAVDAVDETAAGDAFIGYFMAAVLSGQAFVPALRHASAAGALAVTRAGAAPSLPALADVQAFLAARTRD